ncbi:FdtA/QdtA family cupin domain-containing protein [Clostridium sp.]|uniref:sugar 3,4-ketoisomerase n=1 Tax=Clostridium sp. TaxID=1506 RepID=UPI001A448CDD|nr:FdtA/QdtA family cupin domain-containing protein [Clostridium sp.]MBK5241010.1 FdtA/QdtA family cupin domain-containing protein [Clostridium sp.]
MDCKLIYFSQVNEEDGSIVFMEGMKEIPFEIKRVFYIFSTPKGATRADHANKNTDFVLINVYGTSSIEVDDGIKKVVFELSSPNVGLYIPHMTWMKTYNFSSDSVLLALASRQYEKNQYYEDYKEFCETII